MDLDPRLVAARRPAFGVLLLLAACATPLPRAEPLTGPGAHGLHEVMVETFGLE